MPKLIVRIVAVLLIPCLLSDPIRAASLEDQALANVALSFFGSLDKTKKNEVVNQAKEAAPWRLDTLPDFSLESLSRLDWKEHKAGVEEARVTVLAGQPLKKPLIIARKHAVLHDPDHYAFHRQLVMSLLDEYFSKRKEYKARHIRPPIAYTGGHYYYIFTPGTNRIFARHFPSDRLIESREFYDCFYRAGIPIDQDVYLGQKQYTSEQNTARSQHLRSWGWRLHNIVRFNHLFSFAKTRDWVRIDFSNESQSNNDWYRFSQFTSEAHGEGLLLKKILEKEKARLLTLAFAGLPEGSGIYFDQAEFDLLVARYQKDLLAELLKNSVK